MKAYILALALLLIGCQAPPSYVQPTNTSAVINDTQKADGAKVCDIDGTPYYVWDYFIYVKNTKNVSMVMTWVGTYTHNKVKDNWELLPFINTEENVYWDTLDWIREGQLPHGPKVVCNDTEEVPKLLYRFHSTYKPLYDRIIKKQNSTSSFF